MSAQPASVEAVFSAALEILSAAERAAFLDTACGQDIKLRRRVEALLLADAEADSFLDTPVMAVEATDDGMADETDGERFAVWARELTFLAPCEKQDRLGTLRGKVGEYEIIELVGYGGMGAVFRAFDTKLNRIVAVKVMAPELAASPTAVKRFLREAQAAAGVRHDHVVSIYAVDDEHRPPFLVMEFVEGQTLGNKIEREGALELLHILRIGSQIASGLAAAHRLGLIHRDVKPSNILLQNSIERVKITDFGLARATDDVEMTHPGLVTGTPLYMSPEQAQGGAIDTRSDLFSLGSVLYAMCTGRAAFRADTTMVVLRRVCEDAPRSIREVNPDIPDWLEAIIEKLLAKNPADRFQHACELAELLSQHLAHTNNPAHVSHPAKVVIPSLTQPDPSNQRARLSFIAIFFLAAIILSIAVVVPVVSVEMIRNWFSFQSHEAAPAPSVTSDLRQRMQAMPAPFVSGVWTVEGDSLVTEGIAKQSQIIIFGDPAWSDYDLRVEVRDDFVDPAGKKPMANSIVVLADERGDYRWHVDIGAFEDFKHFDLVPFVPEEDGWKSSARRWIPNRLPGKTGVWYAVDVQVRQSNITVLVDGDVVATTGHPKLSRGRVGAASFHTGRSRWRNFEVRTSAGELLWKGLPSLPSHSSPASQTP